MHISKAELIHALTMQQWIDELPSRVTKLCQTYALSSNEVNYLLYCLSASHVQTRDYGMLRRILERNIYEHATRCTKMLEGLIGMEKIDVIYDIGAGHGAWLTILHAIFPSAMLIAVDKEDIHPPPDVEMMKGDVFEIIKTLDYGSHVLYFMAEFLHCKVGNINILNTKQCQNSRLCIIECEPSPAIDWRLDASGGALIDKELLIDLLVKNNKVQLSQLSTMFEHYVIATRP